MRPVSSANNNGHFTLILFYPKWESTEKSRAGAIQNQAEYHSRCRQKLEDI
jgi:hypothetical protein